MIEKSLQIHPAALDETEVALEWYKRRSYRAAEMFLDELYRAMEQIRSEPLQHPTYQFGTRRMQLRRFPFGIIFRETADSIEIIAIAHGRRRPGYWRDRIE